MSAYSFASIEHDEVERDVHERGRPAPDVLARAQVHADDAEDDGKDFPAIRDGEADELVERHAANTSAIRRRR